MLQTFSIATIQAKKKTQSCFAIFNFDSDRPAEKKISFDQIGLGSPAFSDHRPVDGECDRVQRAGHSWKLPPGEAVVGTWPTR